ncbi:hypothetical protein HZA99_00295 [Candidatus Woesearchaeota archaeon]|nr:hypothetical protein [Candidatus Woesearchaeota archaeon]
MNKTIREGKAIITVHDEKKISKDLEVFYNPVMKTNRDLSVAVLKAWNRNHLQVADLFAASGVRTIRFLKELPKRKIDLIAANDYSAKAMKQLKQNLKQNKLQKDKRIKITKKEATLFLLQSNGFDYIDVDPFGTPVPFLDAAAKRLAREGILAVTATDTSALAGAFPDACRRKYSAMPMHGPIMHEIGLRILIAKCQTIAAQYDKALTPIFSYNKDHYMRAFLFCEKGKTKVTEVQNQIGMFTYDKQTAGPMWLGRLWDENFVGKMKIKETESEKLLKTIQGEMIIPQVGFFDIHAICKREKLQIPKYEILFGAIQKAGHKVARTHFSLNGIRTTMEEKELIETIQKIWS